MNFALSDEQVFLKEAARGALSRVKTVEAAREALDGAPLPDLGPAFNVDASWRHHLACLAADGRDVPFGDPPHRPAVAPLVGGQPLEAAEHLAVGEQRQRFVGVYTLRRVNDVDGATVAQRRWHITSAKLKAIPAGR